MQSYQVRVRSKVCVWGSRGLLYGLAADSPLYLTIRVDDFGETTAVGRLRPEDGGIVTDEPYGSLGPGETVTIPLTGASAVYAETNDLSSLVTCTLHGSL
jgi:hypothetical protein